MGGYNKFNVIFCINGVELVDCRAFLKVGLFDYRRIGADEHNNVDGLLTADAVECHALANQINFENLMTEEQMNNEFLNN